MKHKIWIALIAACILFAALPVFAKAEAKLVDSGTWDYILYWEYYSDGTLKIDGKGTSRDSNSGYPWAKYYDQVTKLVISDNISRIPGGAFRSFYKLQSIQFGSSIETIGFGAFSRCINLKSVTIPKTVLTIEANAFSNCERLETVIFAEGYGLKTIGIQAFANTALTHVKIPTNITVGEGAYSNCLNLRAVEVDDGVIFAGRGVFDGCTALNYVHFGRNITNDYAHFKNCNAIEYIQIDDNTSIGVGSSHPRLKMVVLRGEWPGVGGFSDCPELSTVILPESVKRIGYGAFSNCPKLKHIDLPDDLVEIEPRAFSNTGLESIILPDSLTNIGMSSFAGNEDLRYVYCGKGLKNIAQYAFNDCSALETVDLCNVETIYSGAFENCGKLANVIWSEKITMILDTAFKDCDSLQSVFLPASLNRLGVDTFADCDNLKTIIFRGDVPRFGYAFNFHYLKATVYYPADNGTWTEDVRHDYHGELTWKPICAEHTPVVTPAHEASCDQEGLTEGSVCQLCGWVLIPQRGVEATAHSYEEKVTEATCAEGGYTTHTCSTCGSTYVDQCVAALAHKMGDWYTKPQPASVLFPKEHRNCENCDYALMRDTEVYGPPKIFPYEYPTLKPSVSTSVLPTATVPSRPSTSSSSSVQTEQTTTEPVTLPPTSGSTTTVPATTVDETQQQIDPLVEADVKAIAIMLLAIAGISLATMGILIYVKLTKKDEEE